MEDRSIASERNFINKNTAEKYLNFLYWGLCTSSSGSYGDIIAITKLERIFQLIIVILFRIFNAFLVAEVTNFASTYKSAYSDHLTKVY